ncbi:MAG: signal peptidase II [Candidatus Omnitrophica bacterium]|nr:signal peptidase II [Candidatus Omnitrophota bacterium]
MVLTFIVAAVVFLSDFIIKSQLNQYTPADSYPVIKNIFHITLVHNTGAAFGIFSGYTLPLVFIGLVFTFLFLFYVNKEINKTSLFCLSCGLILGGALNNLYDRISLGYVVDYLDFRIWPVFNLSDTCISIGAVFLSYYLLKQKPSDDKRTKNRN